jgi:hypothetical protein
VQSGEPHRAPRLFPASLRSSQGNAPSNQLQSLQARVPILADDDVIVHGDAERSGDRDDLLGHLDVGLRRRRVAGRMVVHLMSGRFIYLRRLSFSMRFARQGTRIGDGIRLHSGLISLGHDRSPMRRVMFTFIKVALRYWCGHLRE